MTSLHAQGKLKVLDSPLIMGIMNANPDSFFKGSRSTVLKEQKSRVDQMIIDGADIIDIGGMSSRPGAKIIDSEEEIQRIEPIVNYCLETHPNIWVSIDTLHAKTAEFCLQKGVHLINDISGGHYDPELISVVSQYQVPYVCMHMKGLPENMIHQNQYDNILHDLLIYFKKRVEILRAAGIKDIIIDPGFGFAKNINQNYYLLRHLHKFKILDYPVMVGLSRKSMIYKTLKTDAENALNGTTVLHTLALQEGADILRVHDPKEAKETIMLYKKYMNADSE